MTLDTLGDRELAIRAAYARLKARAGTHSPSVLSLVNEIPGLRVAVDACFLSNPLATQLFLRLFEERVVAAGRLRDLVERYPRQNPDLAADVAAFACLPAERVLVGNGAAELISAVLADRDGPVLVPVPTFSAYHEFAGTRPLVLHPLHPADGFRLDPDRLLSDVRRHRVSTVVLVNPNNPDGGYLDRPELYALLDRLAEHDVETVLDESFVHFTLDADDRVPMSGELTEWPGVVVLKSMSKDFGIAGLRVGYAVLPPDRVTALRATDFLWNLNGIADFFVSLLPQPEFADAYADCLRRYVATCRTFFAGLRAVPGIRMFPSRANFALVEVLSGRSADDVALRLLARHGVYVRACGDKVGLHGEFLRISSRTDEENAVVLAALADCVG